MPGKRLFRMAGGTAIADLQKGLRRARQQCRLVTQAHKGSGIPDSFSHRSLPVRQHLAQARLLLAASTLGREAGMV